jgi:hypothetical protein
MAMPVNHQLTQQQFERYAYARDNGHLRYIEKDKQCNEFLKGHQWDPIIEAKLMRMKRPALKINKIFATVVTALSQQLNNRVDVAFKPVDGESDDQLAAVMDKVYLAIMRANQYDWLESDVFAYGIVGSRSYFDVRADFSHNFQADVKIRRLHGRNVVLDPDATDYDPDTWKEVFVTKWMTPDEIGAIYSKKDAAYLKDKSVVNDTHFAFDSIDDYNPGSFSQGISFPIMVNFTDDEHKRMRRIRVIERQFRVRERVWHFVDLATGDKSVVPSDWSRAKRERVAGLTGVETVKMETEVIRWRVTADDVLLHDSVSPYMHFTVVPYFPVLQDGESMGIVEHLISVQEQLNKTESQILHIVNTTSNSGWMTRRGNIKNMTVEQLEMRGAETGLVLEVEDPSMTAKIQPNQVPTGLDLVSRKADEYLKEISGFSDSVRGFDRADVAAKAIQFKQQAGHDNNAKYFDNLNRSRYMVARAVLDVIQAYYTEERLIRITGNRLSAQSEELVVNQITPEGTIANDLTVGKYDIAITTVPARDTFEQTQFQQALEMRQLGITIPDEVLIKHSNLIDKREILDQMQAPPSPEQQMLQQLELEKAKAEVRNANADAAEKEANILLKRVQAKAKMLEAQRGNDEDADIPSEVDKESFDRLMRVRDLDLRSRQLDIQEQQVVQQAGQQAAGKKKQSNASRLAS